MSAKVVKIKINVLAVLQTIKQNMWMAVVVIWLLLLLLLWIAR